MAGPASHERPAAMKAPPAIDTLAVVDLRGSVATLSDGTGGADAYGGAGMVLGATLSNYLDHNGTSFPDSTIRLLVESQR